MKLTLVLSVIFSMVYSTMGVASTSSVEKIEGILKNIQPFHHELMLPKNISRIRAMDETLYREILEDYLVRYPKNPTNYRIEFLLGYLQYKNKNYEDAVKYLQKSLGVYTELNDYILFFLGESYQVLKNDERAYQAYSLIDEHSLFYARAVIRKVNILAKLEKFASIKTYLNKKNELLENRSLGLRYVEALVALKEHKTAILQLKKMWFQSKNTGDIEQKLYRYRKTHKIARISNLEYYNKCEYLLQNHEYTKIKKQFRLSYALKNKLKIDTDICVIKAYLFSRDLHKALVPYLARLEKLRIKKDKLFLYNIDFLKLYVAYVKKDALTMRNKATKMLKKYPKYPNNERVQALLIHAYKELKDDYHYFKYVDAYLKNKDYKRNKRRYISEAWKHFYFEKKKYKKAIAYLDQYLQLEHDDLRIEARAKYYRAKAYLKMNNRNKAVHYFIKMMVEDPFGYYSYVAFNHLKENRKKVSQKVILSAIQEVRKSAIKMDLAFFYKHPKIIRIYELITLGLDRFARTEILNFQKVANNETENFSIALFLENLKFYKSSRGIKFRNLRMMPFFPNKKSFLSFWRSFYPKKYRKYVEKYSKKFGVEPEFSWGILREESAYNPFALSTSKAYGLMQLLYPTALETADRIGMTLTAPEELFKPQNNIPLGVKYLDVLLSMFKGNKFYAAASYNGGASNVKKWIKKYADREDIYDWSEEIPFEETNRYIYKVLSSYHTYRLLYEKNYFKIGKIDIFKEVFHSNTGS